MDPNIRRTDWKDTVIIIAALAEQVVVVKELLKCSKVDITIKNKYGESALDKARKNGNAEIESAILSRQSLLEQGRTC